MRLGIIVPGGVDASGEYRVIPALLSLIRRLAQRHELRVIALAQQGGSGRWPLLGAEVINAGRPLSAARACAVILAEHRRRRFDVLHAFWAGTPALAAVAVGRFARIPTLVHAAGGELTALPDIGFGGQLRMRGRWATRWSLANANCVTAASASMLDLASRVGVRALRVPLGADLDQWRSRAPRARGSGETMRLVHVASLNRVKDQPTLLEALAQLRATGRAATLDIVGEDTLHGAVQDLSRQLGLDGAVKFHGFRTQRELVPIVERAHLNLVSSLHEAGPVAMLEAAVAGVPTAGTAVGHLLEWHGDGALTVPCRDPFALAEVIAELFDDDDRRLRLASRAQQRALAEDADFTARSFERCYEQLLG
jgi:glycosyltransferase involved in cell wall biosynthesis